MTTIEHPISVAIETTSRSGAVALGSGDALVEVLAFDAAQRAATQLVVRLDELLWRRGLRPSDVDELYLSAGPGSFTGTRVGATVARTLAQMVPTIRCVAVPTAAAVAEQAREVDGAADLAVVFDARRGRIFVQPFRRGADGAFEAVAPGALAEPAEWLARAARPIWLTGEGLGYHAMSGPGVTILDECLWLPRAEAVWAVGRRRARAGRFVDYHQLQPIYTGTPHAVEQWDALGR